MGSTDSFTLRHRVVDLRSGRVAPSEVVVEGGRVRSVTETAEPVGAGLLLPGFVDAHVHVESSMVPPSEWARVAVAHGTVAAVCDPHEIANVLGEAGVRFMVDDGRRTPFHFWFGCPSCVPATGFETAGASLDAGAIERLLTLPGVHHLAEVMNWPGVLSDDPEVLARLAVARRLGRRIDGHAPGLRGEDARRYAAHGITTDHECTTLDEARDKALAGVVIQVREGSAARDLSALWPILRESPSMLCTDDSHPDDLVRGHVNAIAARAIALGADPMDVLRAACLCPVEHYGLDVGTLRPGDPADFILVSDLERLRVERTWLGGALVAEGGRSLLPRLATGTPNVFRAEGVRAEDLALRARGRSVTVRTITVEDGRLVTGERASELPVVDGVIEPQGERDVLLLAVKSRYAPSPPAVGFVSGLGLRGGALASSVAHDSHNVVAAGDSREAVARTIDAVCRHRGGLALVRGERVEVLPLPIAGLMSDRPAEEVAEAYQRLTEGARAMGASVRAPFMSLGFLALLVIPSLKLGDRGLFDGLSWRFVDVVRSRSEA